MARLEKQFESATVEWPTPDTLWKPLNDEFGFTLDVCATPENAKCARYFTKAQDGLAQEWQGVCWMNPPYGREMVGWLKRAEAEKANGVTTVALIPSRTNTGWWHDVVMKNEVRFVRGRPKFGNADQGLPWPLAVIIFRANAEFSAVIFRHLFSFCGAAGAHQPMVRGNRKRREARGISPHDSALGKADLAQAGQDHPCPIFQGLHQNTDNLPRHENRHRPMPA